MSLAVGSRLGPYEITGKLGAGGMGEVYGARDTKLNRHVAIKVLPESFATDPDRLARFTREAQVLASLNHPNIAAIYGLEGKAPLDDARGAMSESRTALVMELVDGEDLSASIQRGPMALADALPIAKQIADALEAAHEQGIVHRDLKPGNIKVKADGTVKVLDFGLAKALSYPGSEDPGLQGNAANSPTLTARATEMGMVLGTAAYMSPEQARGKPVDRRADIWAFGVVLYEMLTGSRAFEGDDVSITLANVLKDEPKWHALPADLPAPISRLLRRCLEKDPKRRLSSIGDARLELDERDFSGPDVGKGPRGGVPAQPQLLARLLPALAGVVVTAVAAYAFWPANTGTTPAGNLARLSILAPAGTTLYPDSASVAISPDGSMVAFIVGSVTQGDNELWVRSLDSARPRRLEDTKGAVLPFWSPDGKRIGFMTNQKLMTIAVSGGRAEVLADTPGPRGAVWTPSGVIIYAPDAGGPLFSISASGGGEPKQITKIDASLKEYGHRFPVLLPDGEHFLYAALPGKNGKFDIYAGSLKDDSRVLIGPMDGAPVYADPGWLLYARQGALVAVPFNPMALEITGDPVRMEDEPSSILDPAISFTAGRTVSISRTGSLSYYSAPSPNTVATWHDTNGVATGSVNLPAGHYGTATISPDGSRAVLSKSISPSESILWLVDLARGGGSPLSTGSGRNDAPVWSPDGKRVVFNSDRTGVEDFYVKSVDDNAPEQLLYHSEIVFKAPIAWSKNGALAYIQLDPGTSQNLWLLDAAGKAAKFAAGPRRENGGPLSPDEKWIAYASEDTGRFEVYVQSFPTPSRQVQVSEDGAVFSWWSRDGRQMVLLGGDFRSLYRIDVVPGPTFRTTTPKKFATLPVAPLWVEAHPDFSKFLVITPERTGAGSVTVVQNWTKAIQK